MTGVDTRSSEDDLKILLIKRTQIKTLEQQRSSLYTFSNNQKSTIVASFA